jgi:uncharacterized protein YecT (DUF1311 family)
MKKALLTSVMLLAALSAHAQTIKQSPETGYAGAWRIVDARPAPWIKPHALSKDEAPLLEFVLVFRDGEVLGPSPIACGHAGYRFMQVPISDLNQAGVPKGKEKETADALGLESGSISTLHVDCDGGTFDYYRDTKMHLVLLLNNVVYTLQRAEQTDAAPGYSGPSFDCLKANTAVEKTVCLDEELSKFDRQMAAAYTRLSKTQTPDSFATVQAAQRAWLAYTTKSCGSGRPMPDVPWAKNDIKDCLYEEYNNRATSLEGLEVLKAGTLTLEPRMFFHSRAKPSMEESDFYPWMTGGPEASAFNTCIAKKLAPGKSRIDKEDLSVSEYDIDSQLRLFARRTYSVRRFDSRIASLLFSTYDFIGGQQVELNEISFNWDVQRRKPIGLDDIFAKGKKWERFVVDYCMEGLESQSSGNQGSPDRSEVAQVVGEGGNWLFDKDEAIVHFTFHALASFSVGETDVEIPYEDLKPYMRPDAPVL